MNGFPQNNDEAASRFKEYKSKDPFPDIPPALLNSADVADYVRETGMIYPFDLKDLKSASYEIRLWGRCIYWDERSGKQNFPLEKEGDKFDLKQNSIAYIDLGTTFRVPDYIALRFNLRITNVHRGLLLGTGPLVDPGFEGHLLIPLHNLTNNDYTFEYNEGFIWVEFTKLSPNGLWAGHLCNEARHAKYKPFLKEKTYLSAEFYLGKALRNNVASTIESSIPAVIQNAQSYAEKASRDAGESLIQAEGAVAEVKSVRTTATVVGGLAVLAVIIAGFALVFQVNGLIDQVNSNARQDLQRLSDQLLSLEREIGDIKVQVNEIAKSNEKIPRLEERLNNVQDQQNRITKEAGSTGVGKIQTQNSKTRDVKSR